MSDLQRYSINELMLELQNRAEKLKTSCFLFVGTSEQLGETGLLEIEGLLKWNMTCPQAYNAFTSGLAKDVETELVAMQIQEMYREEKKPQ